MLDSSTPLKILIVDDDEIDRMTVRRALKKAEIQGEVFEANLSATAMDVLRSQTFDCVFLDYRLPDQDGLSLVKLIRAEGITSPLIVLTGQGDEQVAVDLMKAGASDYLAKSKISSGRIAQMLRNAIRVHQAELQAVLANEQLKESYNLLLEQHKALEEQRQKIYEQNLQLIHAAALKSRFLATISHELRTPLNAILGFSQMLMRPSKGVLNGKQIEMVQRILINGKNLLQMLNEVLDFTQIEANRLHLKPELFDLEELVSSTVEEVRSLAALKDLLMTTEFNLQDPFIFNDPMRLRQALVNLLSNAIKFTEVGKVWVEVKEASPNHILIAIHDTGIGIAPEHIKYIFEAFRQIDQTITRKHQGTGLGLAITQTLIHIMGGTLTVISEVGRGSKFVIEIPRQIEGNRSASALKVKASRPLSEKETLLSN